VSKYETVLVLGGTGFLGKNLQKVRPNWIYVGRTTFVENGVECNLEDLSIAYVGNETDYTDAYSVGNLIGAFKPDAVINLAADVGGIAYNEANQLSIYENNTLMNTNILSTCRELEVERVLSCLSTCVFPQAEIYPQMEDDFFCAFNIGTPDNPEPHAYVHPFEGHMGYGWSKRMLHVHTLLCRQAGYNYSTFTPSNLYGPHDHMGEDSSHFVASLLHKVEQLDDANLGHGETLHLLGDGKALRQFLYAPDLAKVIPRLLEEHNGHLPLIITPKENLSIDEMAKMAMKVLNKNASIEYSGDHIGQYRKDCSSRLARVLLRGFRFTPFEEGILQTYEWYRKSR